MRRMGLLIGFGLLLVVGLLLTLELAQPAKANTLLDVCDACTYQTIQSAINVAGSGGTIRVAQGVYPENLTVNKEVVLEGGYEAVGWTRDVVLHETIIDGGGAGSVVRFAGDSDGAILDGFTVRNGKAERGGGIYISGSPAIKNCLITNNNADEGAGLAIYEGANPLIINNDIVSNTASCCGGGIRVIASGGTIQNNRILSNTAQSWAGGGMEIAGEAWTTVISNSIFGNTAAAGGGIAVNWYCTVTITANEIVSNVTSNGGGGGMYVSDHSTVTVDRNTIKNNAVTAGGGGILIYNGSAVTVTSNVIASNLGLNMAWDGDGICVWAGDSDVKVLNNTIVSNTAEGIQADDGMMLVRNNIIYGNSGGIHNYQAGATVASDHNAFWNNGWNYLWVTPGPGDISADPRFVNVAEKDFHLSSDSPCVDSGANVGAPTIDFDGDPRPLDGNLDGVAITDIGADEFRPYRIYLPVVQK